MLFTGLRPTAIFTLRLEPNRNGHGNGARVIAD
jgi:hypothetical protein